MPPLTLDGTTGVSAVQAGSIQSDDLAAGVGGKVLQVVSEFSTNTNLLSSSTSFIDTGLSISITPSSITSKILVIFNHPFISDSQTNDDFNLDSRILRDSSQIFECRKTLSNRAATGDAGYVRHTSMTSLMVLDSPNSTSTVTYKTQIKASGAGNPRVGIENATPSRSDCFLMEIAG